MSIEAMKQALDALETNKQKHDVCEDIFYSCPFYSGGACTCGADKANAEIHEVIASLRQAIAAAKKQKPVAWRSWNDKDGYGFWDTKAEANSYCDLDCEAEPLYTIPPQPKKETNGC